MPGFCKSDKEQNSLSFLVADCFTKLCKSILVFPDSKISRGKPKTIQIVKASSLYNYIFCGTASANLARQICINGIASSSSIISKKISLRITNIPWSNLVGFVSDNCSITTGNTTPLCPESRRRCCLCLTLYVSAT